MKLQDLDFTYQRFIQRVIMEDHLMYMVSHVLILKNLMMIF